MMTKQLSQKEKIKICEYLVDRDSGYKCFYCKKPFLKDRSIIEHLNDNRTDNRLDNLVLSCQSCNIKKARDKDCIYNDIAFLKLEKNENQIYLREKDLKKITKYKEEETSIEIDINTKNFDIVQDYIETRVDSFESIEFKDTLDSCVLLCRKKTNHGSHQCVRNYISALTSSVGFYQIVKKNTKNVIVKKTQ